MNPISQQRNARRPIRHGEKGGMVQLRTLCREAIHKEINQGKEVNECKKGMDNLRIII